MLYANNNPSGVKCGFIWGINGQTLNSLIAPWFLDPKHLYIMHCTLNMHLCCNLYFCSWGAAGEKWHFHVLGVLGCCSSASPWQLFISSLLPRCAVQYVPELALLPALPHLMQHFLVVLLHLPYRYHNRAGWCYIQCLRIILFLPSL